MLDCAATQELLPASLLDALEVEEQLAVMEHLRRCASCRAEAEVLRPVVGALGFSVPNAGAPAARIKDRLMSQVIETVHPRPIIPQRRWVFRPIAALVPAAIGLILIIGLSAWAVSLQSQLNQQAARLDRLTQQQVAIGQFMIAAQLQPVNVQFVGSTSAVATMFVSPNSIAMAVRNLPVLQGEEVYQCWWMDESKQDIVPGTWFKVDANGAGVWVWERPANAEYRIMAITREPHPGNPQAEGPLILTAKF